MANDVKVRVSAPGAKQATGEIKGFRDGFDRLQKQGAKGFGIGVGASATTAALGLVSGALQGVGDLMGDSLQAASDLNESMGKSSVVFGKSADDMEKWADTAAESFGQSKQQALEAAGTYGNLFQAFGVGQQKSAEMSKSLVQLAADLASFNNTSVDDALVALRSGLSGETEPLKRYGIAISDARMRTELANQGYKNLGATLTPLQKSMASYALIMKDSSLAQGDFARTSDGVANAIRTNKALIEDLHAEIGQKAIPVEKAWLDIQRDSLGVVGALAAATDAQSQSVEENAGSIQDLVGWLAPWAGGLIDAKAANLVATEAAKKHGAAVESLSLEVRDEGRAAAGATGPTDDLANEVKDLGRAARDAEEEVDDLASTIEDELFGDAITAGNEARLKENIRDLRKQREEARKGSPEWVELTGEIAENRQALFELHLEEAKKKGPQAVIDFLEEQKGLFKNNRAEIQRLIDKYKALYLVQQTIGPVNAGIRYTGVGGSLPGRAAGGPVQSGMAYTVGEHGPETLVMGGQSGTIIPHAGAGGGHTFNFTFNGVSDVSASSARRFGRIVMDEVAQGLRQQNARLPVGTAA